MGSNLQSQEVRGGRQISWLLATWLACCCGGLIGCSSGPHAGPAAPHVTSRFAPGLGLPATAVLGLAMQCANDPMQSYYSQRMAAAVATELELTQASLRVQPWTAPLPEPRGVQPLAMDAAGPVPPEPAAETGGDIINISFQQPLDVLPPQDLAAPPLPEFPQGLQIRLLEFRPWAPMKAAVQLTVVDTATLQPLSSTTAVWTASSDGEISGGCGLPEKRRWWQRKRRLCDESAENNPAPGHNSPEAFLQVIAQDIAAWYALSSPQAVFE